MHGMVLIAEDNPDIGEFLVQVLTDAGYDASLVGDGEAAMVSVRRRWPDLIITDMSMPKLDGLALRAALRHQGFDHIPVLLMSASPRPPEVLPDSFIAKPFDLPRLLDLVPGCLLAVSAGKEVDR